MAIVLRRLTEADAELAARMVHALLAELSPEARTERVALEQAARDVLAMDTAFGLLASSEDTPVGLMMLNESATIYAGGRIGTITELYVVPDYRSKRVAPELMQAAIALGRDRGWGRLEVGAPKQPAWERTLAFYQREGFVEVGPRLKKSI
ncbi:GNAT family N-acetyltransferase [Hyphomicrobium sp. CS1BSMeth3]|uniref:GNAT family N-acetyltransferase n=1 Tax=Hyphomicrobium sp. CS1BSMeth3 TaxID=1892844 RepID=UPI0009301D70|nr:GNAT family N-acetyltransferase [Hyphomicrobium sp. CS1BSMeth3]